MFIYLKMFVDIHAFTFFLYYFYENNKAQKSLKKIQQIYFHLYMSIWVNFKTASNIRILLPL